MVPSGDDGVRSVDEAVELVAEAGRRGTAVQYATPHAMDRHPFTPERVAGVLAARDRIRARLDGAVDFRIGWEISPEPWFLDADPIPMALEGLDACLLELPLPHTRPRSLDLLIACAEHIEAAGLTPILGHPERCHLVFGELGWVTRFRRRGWLTQVNASSLLGRHGSETQEAASRQPAALPGHVLRCRRRAYRARAGAADLHGRRAAAAAVAQRCRLNQVPPGPL
jgi:protein-tyrosine phosphatase